MPDQKVATSVQDFENASIAREACFIIETSHIGSGGYPTRQKLACDCKAKEAQEGLHDTFWCSGIRGTGPGQLLIQCTNCKSVHIVDPNYHRAIPVSESGS